MGHMGHMDIEGVIELIKMIRRLAPPRSTAAAAVLHKSTALQCSIVPPQQLPCNSPTQWPLASLASS